MCGGNRLRCPGAAAVYLLSAYVCLEFWVEWVPFVVFLGLWVLWMRIVSAEDVICAMSISFVLLGHSWKRALCLGSPNS